MGEGALAWVERKRSPVWGSLEGQSQIEGGPHPLLPRQLEKFPPPKGRGRLEFGTWAEAAPPHATRSGEGGQAWEGWGEVSVGGGELLLYLHTL